MKLIHAAWAASLAALVASVPVEASETLFGVTNGTNTFTGVQAFAPGSAAAPALANSSALTTGLYWPSTIQMAIAISAGLKFQFTSSFLGMGSGQSVSWFPTASISGSADTSISRLGVGLVGINGQLAIPKVSGTGTAPGAGQLKLEVVAGTNAGSCKIQAYAGTSTTPVTVLDNVGSGC